MPRCIKWNHTSNNKIKTPYIASARHFLKIFQMIYKITFATKLSLTRFAALDYLHKEQQHRQQIKRVGPSVSIVTLINMQSKTTKKNYSGNFIDFPRSYENFNTCLYYSMYIYGLFNEYVETVFLYTPICVFTVPFNYVPNRHLDQYPALGSLILTVFCAYTASTFRT